ncbi:MAG: cupin domain-containing protein [Saprospiraceae bacterium]
MNTFKSSKTFRPDENIAYADGSVVSKMVIKKPTGNITLFAFDKDEGLSEHSSPHDVLIQILDGIAEITIAGNPQIIHKGECIIFPSNVPHSLKAKEKFKMMLTMIKS